jgi:hypothetical protein
MNLVLHFGTKSTVATASILFNTSNIKANGELNCCIITVQSAALGHPSTKSERSV